MKFNYDLVIIGATAEGIYAAQETVKFTDRRIALVIQGVNVRKNLFDAHFQSYLTDFTRQKESLFCLKKLGYYTENCPTLNNFVGISQNLSQAAVNANDCLSILAAQGIDVIENSGTFNSDHPLSFEVANRKLRSRSYLLAIGPQERSNLPNFERGEHWGIVGATPENIAWANLLALNGKKVTLITRNPHILPKEDRDVTHLLQAYLEAININLIVNTKVQTVTEKNSQKILELAELNQTSLPLHPELRETNSENCQITVDFLIESTFNSDIHLKLNLKEIGVKFNQNRILVNSYLQTDNPQVYAIGSAIAGYQLMDIAQQEANLVVKNLLTARKNPINYGEIPYSLISYPSLIRVGLTESQARQIYGDQIEIVTHSNSPTSLFTNPIIPECSKFIFAPDTTLKGAHILGGAADNYHHSLAIAITQHLKKEQILYLISPTLFC